MLTHHLTAGQLSTLKQQHPQIFLQQKHYIRWVTMIGVGVFCITFFSSKLLGFRGKHLLMAASK